jgi:LAO/AO transport system kinase
MAALSSAEPGDPAFWEPPIVKTVATRDQGVAELAAAVDGHRAHLEASGQRRAREVARARAAFLSALREQLLETALERLSDEEGRLDEIAERIATRQADPYALVEELAARLAP